MAKRVTATGPIEGPWALPDGWRWERLGDVARRIADKHNPDPNSNLPFVGMDAIAPHSMKASEGQAFREMRSAASAFRPGDVLYGRLRPYLNKVWYATFAGACSGELIVIRPSIELEARYLAFLLHGDAFVEFATHAVSGDRPRIDFGTMSDYPVPVPPTDVQRQIVARIDELFAEIDNGQAALGRARDDLATWRKALLKAAVTGELTADWRAATPPTETGADLLYRLLSERRAQWAAAPRNKGKKYKEPAKPDLELFGTPPELPTGWTWASAAQLTTLVTSGSRGWAEYYSEAGATFIRAQNINTDTLRLAGIAYVTPPKGGEGSRTRVSKGDILITITGANVTKSALVDIDLNDAYVSQHVGLMRPTDIATAAFLFWWIITPAGGRRILERLAYGAGKPGLNLPNLLGLPVPLPPLDEQREIARICASVDDERAACVDVTIEGQQAASILRQSILAAAFRGELA